ncbi:hypothetical protein ACLB2K_008964 [Fragaria x ananassa]
MEKKNSLMNGKVVAVGLLLRLAVKVVVKEIPNTALVWALTRAYIGGWWFVMLPVSIQVELGRFNIRINQVQPWRFNIP